MSLRGSDGSIDSGTISGWDLLERSSGPPSFCRWNSIGGVAAVALLTGWLILLGTAWPLDARTVLLVLLHSLVLGLFCAYCVCAFKGVLERLSTRNAWMVAWLVVVVSAFFLSYLVGMVSTVLGFGPETASHGGFVTRSTLATAIVSLALFRYLYVRARWQAEMLSQSEARVEALQARIRPHFLFNSLNTIASLVHDDPEGAERATEDLAELFRSGMRANDELVPLSDELKLARKYLAMEQRRIGERLRVEWSIDDLPMDQPVLPLLLQPLLENAVAHGVQPRAEGGVVSVHGRCEGERLVITIRNPLAPSGSRPGHGMALNNIRSRLALTHSATASLLTHQDDESFYAVLTLPYAQAADR